MNKLNDLTISLLAIGLGLIVMVIVFNWWQERKMRKAAEKQIPIPQDDLLMDQFEERTVSIDTSTKIKDVVVRHELDEVQFRNEVEFKIDIEGFDHGEGALDGKNESNIEAPRAEVEEPILAIEENLITEPIKTNILPEVINKDVDLTALLFLPSPFNGDQLRKFFMSMVNLDKPIFAYGLDESQVWQRLTREQENSNFTKAAFSLQLADRAGPVSNETLQRFQKIVSEVAYELSAQVEWMGTHEPLEYAKALDAFCLEVDQTVGFHILNGASGRFTGTKFRGLAEANGMTLKDDGAFYARSINEQTKFKIINMENNPFNVEMLRSIALKGVTFQMEIALTENCTETFNSMVLTAKSMASSLSATLIDDHQRELSDAKIEKIRQQLKLIQVQMTVKGIPPGSAVALRLFS